MCLVDVVILQFGFEPRKRSSLVFINLKTLANEIDMFGSLTSFGSNKTIWFGKRLVDNSQVYYRQDKLL
jgi:hypothetical protein